MTKKIRNICCIGAGYVGGPTMAVIAQKCPEIRVNIVDINEQRIDDWNNSDLSKLPIYEPGLADIISEVRNRNLFFSTDINRAITEAEMIFISVNTPTKTYGLGKGMASDLKFIELCARQIANVAMQDKIIVEKSTLPVKTAESIKNILQNAGNGVKFQVLSNPEFLAEGTAIADLNQPDRVLIGGDSNTAEGRSAMKDLVEIYENWVPSNKIIQSNIWSSELSKLTANAFLAQRVSSINALSELCEVTGADISEVSNAVGMDSRIGSKFLNASVGFGGSCFQKDILNLVYISRSYGLNEVADYWEQVIKINDHQKRRFANKIIKKLYNTVSGKKISFLGWAFKKDTNDTRESPAIYVADALLNEEANISVFDPQVDKGKVLADIMNMRPIGDFLDNQSVKVHENPYLACENAHAIAVLTEWEEFKNYNWGRIYDSMVKPAIIFDGRNILDSNNLRKIGFTVINIGKADILNGY